ncbi:hypothetical protein K1719_008291 [Acacia pycnantha]|nr:hypothetical protein K1719_008291 [Acacia pycnantha]
MASLRELTINFVNGLGDALLDVYQDPTLVKELWDRLEAKYMEEDATKELRNQDGAKDTNAHEKIHMAEK